MSKNYKHTTVLLKEAVNVLNIRSNGVYVDATFGRGGHSKIILSKLGTKGRLIAIDCDISARDAASTINDKRFLFIKGKFSILEDYIAELGLLGNVDGILLDLGVSGPQLENKERGFSFMRDGPLDMRMDTSSGQSAADWLEQASVDCIHWVLKNFGEEKFARNIAKAIFNYKINKHPITSTRELALIIENTIPFMKNKKNPARRSFQAIRIYINSELEELKRVLDGALSVLAPGGRLSVISFHSLEDRIVKKFIKKYSYRPIIPEGIPLTEYEIVTLYKKYCKLKYIGKIRPSDYEISTNSRARSSILRFAEKL